MAMNRVQFSTWTFDGRIAAGRMTLRSMEIVDSFLIHAACLLKRQSCVDSSPWLGFEHDARPLSAQQNGDIEQQDTERQYVARWRHGR